MVEYNDSAFWFFLRHHIPRILSQLDRDEDSPTFGSFDRNFWHYKIRDFSSVILQQGMLVLNALYNEKRDDNPFYQHPLVQQWIEGCLSFWASQQLSNGSFNEYYPREAGYPPTAFSLYAVGIIMRDRNYIVDDEKVRCAIRKSFRWLMSHNEKEASNQEAAALSGLMLCKNIEGIHTDAAAVSKRLSNFYKMQSDEGWFPEYDGPDTGYLSVTIDCLWDLYDVTHDERAVAAIRKAVGYISRMVSVSGHTPVMINARNTDYLVPYGMIRYAADDPLAAAVVRRLFENINDPGHFLHRIDDRYACHYIFQSCFRSLPYIEKMTSETAPLPCDTHYDEYLTDAGIRIIHIPERVSLFINAKKGGVVNIFDTQGIKKADFGWRLVLGKNKVAVSHWLDRKYSIKVEDDTITIQGRMSKHRWMKPTPLKHFLLRIMSFFIGYKLMAVLKKVMIFGNPSVDITFKRAIVINDDKLIIDDHFAGRNLIGKKLFRAPHYSLRHVSSAGSFTPEELLSPDKEEIIPAPGANDAGMRTEIRL
jgi:hypothetical protein